MTSFDVIQRHNQQNVEQCICILLCLKGGPSSPLSPLYSCEVCVSLCVRGLNLILLNHRYLFCHVTARHPLVTSLRRTTFDGIEDVTQLGVRHYFFLISRRMELISFILSLIITFLKRMTSD